MTRSGKLYNAQNLSSNEAIVTVDFQYTMWSISETVRHDIDRCGRLLNRPFATEPIVTRVLFHKELLGHGQCLTRQRQSI